MVMERVSPKASPRGRLSPRKPGGLAAGTSPACAAKDVRAFERSLEERLRHFEREHEQRTAYVEQLLRSPNMGFGSCWHWNGGGAGISPADLGFEATTCTT